MQRSASALLYFIGMKRMTGFKALTMFISLTGSLVLVTDIALATSTAPESLIRLERCQYETSGQLKAQKRIQSVPQNSIVDLSFQSRVNREYPIVDLFVQTAQGPAQTWGSIDLSKISAGANYLTTTFDFQSQPTFLVAHINEEDCFYAQVGAISAAPESLALANSQRLFPSFSLTTGLGEEVHFQSMLYALAIFALLFIWLERAQGLRRRLSLSL